MTAQRATTRWTLTAALSLLGVLTLSRHPGFFRPEVWGRCVEDNALLGLLATGETWVLLAGGIDLSVGGCAALASVALADLVELRGLDPLSAALLVVSAGALFGALQGWLVARLSLAPLLVTAASLLLLRAAALAWHDTPIEVRHPLLARDGPLALQLGGLRLGSGVCVWALVASLSLWCFHRERLGRHVRALGGSPRAALELGLPVDRLWVVVFAFSGTCAALGGVTSVLDTRSGSAALAGGLELDAVVAALAGGASLIGGAGGFGGTLCGVLVLGWMQCLIVREGLAGPGIARAAAGLALFLLVALQRLFVRLPPRSPWSAS